MSPCNSDVIELHYLEKDIARFCSKQLLWKFQENLEEINFR